MQAFVQSRTHDSIVRFVADYAGFDLSSATVRERAQAKIAEHIARSGVTSLSRYAEALRREQGAELAALVDALRIGETYFFRETSGLDLIRTELLPTLLSRRSRETPIVAWSAGCSTGEEPYSVAILMDQAFLGDRAHVIATDISRRALAHARRARYRRWSLRGTTEELLRRYFLEENCEFLLNHRIRDMVHFEHHNLAYGSPPASLRDGRHADLVLLRNVLIYFTPEVIDRVSSMICDTLADDGLLITGACDPLLDRGSRFELVSAGGVSVYRRRASSGPLQPRVENPPVVARPTHAASTIDTPVTPVPSALAIEIAARSSADSERASENDACGESHDSSALAEAELALRTGDYPRVMAITAWFAHDPHACSLRIKALANLRGVAEAARECSECCDDHPLAIELHFLHALLLMDRGQSADAAESLRRVLYLDHSVVVAHFALSVVLEHLGDTHGAYRALRNASELCAALPPDEILPLSEGKAAGGFANDVFIRLEHFDLGDEASL